MIRFIQTLIVLWEKRKILTLMELETAYISMTHADKIHRDTEALRGKLAGLKNVKNPTADAKVEMVELESQINETEKMKQILQSSKDKTADLQEQIKLYRKMIWW